MISLIALLALNPFLSTTETEIFHLILKRCIAFEPHSKRVFILDTDEQTVLIYDKQLSKIQTFGGKGRGPGKLNQTYGLTVFEDKLLTLGYREINQFDLDGNFIQRWNKPPELGKYQKVVNGWAGLTSWDVMNPEKPMELIHFSNSFKDRIILGSWKRPLKKIDIKNPRKYFNPSEPSFNMIVSQDKKKVVVLPQIPNNKFWVYDLTSTTKQPKIVDSGWNNIPFDEDWGKKQLKKWSPNSRPVFPKYFPTIDHISSEHGPQATILLKRFNAYDPESSQNYKAFDWNGEAVSLDHITNGEKAIIAEFDDWALIRHVIDEEHVLIRIPRDQVEDFVKKHPYKGMPHMITPSFGL